MRRVDYLFVTATPWVCIRIYVSVSVGRVGVVGVGGKSAQAGVAKIVEVAETFCAV